MADDSWVDALPTPDEVPEIKLGRKSDIPLPKSIDLPAGRNKYSQRTEINLKTGQVTTETTASITKNVELVGGGPTVNPWGFTAKLGTMKIDKQFSPGVLGITHDPFRETSDIRAGLGSTKKNVYVEIPLEETLQFQHKMTVAKTKMQISRFCCEVSY